MSTNSNSKVCDHCGCDDYAYVLIDIAIENATRNAKSSQELKYQDIIK